MNWLIPLFGVAIALSGQNAFGKNRLTDPVRLHGNAKATWSTCAEDFGPVAIASYVASRHGWPNCRPCVRPHLSQRNNATNAVRVERGTKDA
ncbi:hypothetical protein ABIF65_006718 [Bradyrhizobium japonicum]|nr:hypothetical protein [Bradyrhizobium japonicum]MCP1960886.1 hypothetical protein [Bradyrhizobium japonicum]